MSGKIIFVNGASISGKSTLYERLQARLNPGRICRTTLTSMALAVILSGCFTGPKYDYARQADSASIVGAAVLLKGVNIGDCGIVLGRVDGMATNFTASDGGYDSSLIYAWISHVIHEPDSLYLAPGKHSLDLRISYSDESYGNVGGGQTGLVGTYSAGGTPTIKVDLVARHVYRLGANLEGAEILITLWDETNGATARTNAATWTVKSNGGYIEATLPN